MRELRPSATRQDGFSLTELVVTLAVALILIAVGLPAFLRAYHAYELSNAARQVADILRLGRYEAIRLNTPVQCIIQASGSNPGYTDVWVDSIPNGVLDSTEKVILLGPSGNLIDGGSVPNTSGMISSAVGTFGITAPSSASCLPPGAPSSASCLPFDARGAVIPPTAVNVFYLSSALAPEAGYRAVLLLPAGSIQIWTSDNSGNWQQLQ